MKQIIANALAQHKKMVAEFETEGVDTLITAAEMIIKAINDNGCVYLCGNGGSAADCQHIAGEFVGRFLRERRPLPAVAFSTNTSVITAIGNDYGFDDIFSKQAQALVKQNDILWAFSTSGNSKNVIAAAEVAKKKGAAVIAFTGRANSKLEAIADLCLCADAPNSFGAQQIHQIAYHLICDLVERDVCK
jgi:D-sedoheptulose 7-phosphate isomerase